MQRPDKVTIIFNDSASQFNGQRLDIMRKQNNILMKFHDVENFDDKKARQALGLIERMKKNSKFNVLAGSDVPDAHYEAVDITPQERENALFIAPAQGETVDSAYEAMLIMFYLLKAKANVTSQGPQI